MRSTRNLLLLRSGARRAPSTVLSRFMLRSSGPLSTSASALRVQSQSTEPQRREYTVELAQATLDLGKQVPRDQMTPLSRLMSSITVEQILAHKPDQIVYEVDEDEPVIHAIQMMCDKKIGSVVVRGSETQLDVGMLSRIDCMRNLVLKNQFARETPIKRVMNSTVRSFSSRGMAFPPPC